MTGLLLTAAYAMGKGEKGENDDDDERGRKNEGVVQLDGVK